jgi:hypothetical protein
MKPTAPGPSKRVVAPPANAARDATGCHSPVLGTSDGLDAVL